MTTDKNVKVLQNMAKTGKKPSEMLRFLVLEENIEDQIILMKSFCKAFNLNLGQVTAISGWWHDDTAELNDTDIDAYIQPLINSSSKVS